MWDETWLETQRNHAKEKLKSLGINRKMEVLISPMNLNLNIPQTTLLDIADESQIQTSGWPIGVVFKYVPELKPTPKTDGVISEIAENSINQSYDFTYFKKSGQILILKSLFEEKNFKNSIIPDVRIRRTTELLLYVSRFYSRCELPVNEKIKIDIKYLGLDKNKIDFANNRFSRIQRTSKENECDSEIITSISEIENKLPELVAELLQNLFVLFDFYKSEFENVKSIVSQYVIETKNARR